MISFDVEMDFFSPSLIASLDKAAGGSEDWGKGSLRAEYTYVVELRDIGKHGFFLPASEIEPTTQEIYTAIKAVGSRLLEDFES